MKCAKCGGFYDGSSCVNCGWSGETKKSVAPRPEYETPTKADGCKFWYSCFNCPFRMCLIEELSVIERNEVEGFLRKYFDWGRFKSDIVSMRDFNNELSEQIRRGK